MLRSISATLICAASISVQAFEVQLPQYISPGEQVVLSASPIAQYDEFAWQSSSFYAQLQSYGEKQQFAVLKLPKYASDTQIDIYTYALQGWSYETKQNLIEVRANKPKLPSSIAISGPDTLLLDQPNVLSLQGVEPNTSISWQAVDDNGSNQGIALQNIADNQVELSLDSAVFQSENINVLATVNISGWQYQVTKSFNLDGQITQPNLVINTQNTYQEHKSGQLSALVEHTSPDDEVTYQWRVINKGLAEAVTLSSANKAQTDVLVEGIEKISKVTLAVTAEINSLDKTASLTKEFDITVKANKAPSLNFTTSKQQLWAGEAMQVVVEATDPEQDTTIVTVENLTPDFISVSNEKTNYLVKANAVTADAMGKIKLTVEDLWGNSSSEILEVKVRRLPTISFTHMRRLYANSPGFLKAEIDIPVNQVQAVEWQQVSGEPVLLNKATEFEADYVAHEGGTDLSFSLNLTLSPDVVLSVKTNINVLNSQRLNDTGDVSYIDKNARWAQDSLQSLAGLDALSGRDASEVLLKQGAGPQGFDFDFLSDSGAVLPAFSSQAACLRDNHTGSVWLLKNQQNGDLQTKKTLVEIAADITALNQKQRCGKQTWLLPSAPQLLSVLSTNQSEHTFYWLTGSEPALGRVFSRLQLLSSTEDAGQNYIVNWYPSTLTSSWSSSSNAYHFLLIAGE
tara:strand:+ start:1753 stop:3804 length:2052 start_codon:yes stop_codon:yes gene_type:complete